MILCVPTISFSSFPIWVNAHSLDEVIRILTEIGYPAVEILADRPHALPADLRAGDRRTMKRKLVQAGLKVPAVCAQIGPNRNPASPFKAELQASRKYLTQCVQLASDLESSVLIYPAGWSVTGMDPQESYRNSCETLAQLALLGEKHGVRIAVEATLKRASNLVHLSSQAVEMIRKVGHPYAKVMMDSFHVWAENEDIAQVIEAYGADLVHVHLEDMSENRLDRRALGQGVADVEQVLALLKSKGYKSAVSLELWGADPQKMVRDSYQYLKGLPTKYFE